MARNGVIGANNKLPWHLPADLRQFKSLTMGHHIVMGRKTWESIGRPLPGRTSVVMTRDATFQAPGALTAHSLPQALAACADDDEVFIIGGAQVFAAALPLAQRIYLTTLDADFAGDTWMPPLDLHGWRQSLLQNFPADAENAYPFSFAIYDRA